MNTQESQHGSMVERTNLRAYLASTIVSVIGITLLAASHFVTSISNVPALQNLLSELGALCIVSVALALTWELWAKRAFVDEIYSKAQISMQMQKAGLAKVAYEPHDIDWEQLFDTSRKVDVHLMYGRNWRGTHKRKIISFLDRPDTKLRLVFPDPENDELIKGLLTRMKDFDAEKLTQRIKEAIEDSLLLAKGRENMEVWTTQAMPAHSLWLFDSIAILSLYTYQAFDVGTGIPHFIATEGGSVYKFVEAELIALTDDANKLHRKLYPIAEQHGN